MEALLSERIHVVCACANFISKKFICNVCFDECDVSAYPSQLLCEHLVCATCIRNMWPPMTAAHI